TQSILAYSEFVPAIRDFAAQHFAHRCDLARQLACLDMSTGSVGNLERATHEINSSALARAVWQQRFEQLNTIWLEIFRECFCSALLPPCPDVTGGNCIPLAVVTIDTETCNVIEICNWTAREFALTLPTLYYWTSFIQWGAIKDVIAKLCCGTTEDRTWVLLMDLFAQIVESNTSAAQQFVPERRNATAPAGTPGPVGGTPGAAAGAPRASHSATGSARSATGATSGGGAGGTGSSAGGSGSGSGGTDATGGGITGTASQTLLALSGFLHQATLPD